MSEKPAKSSRPMPKGGRKGGSVFPRVSLSDAIGYAKKLVSKTHVSAQPQDVIYSGVVGAKSGIGAVRVSALRQYGFLAGDQQTSYAATDLAKQVASAPQEERRALYRQAMLKPTVFKKLFDTFQSDVVSKAKLKQRAADLNVHPDETGACIDLYIAGMLTAELVVVEGEQVTHVSATDLAATPAAVTGPEPDAEDQAESLAADRTGAPSGAPQQNGGGSGKGEVAGVGGQGTPAAAGDAGPRAVFNVSVTLDSSLDIDKLQKQLELLKRFGAI